MPCLGEPCSRPLVSQRRAPSTTTNQRPQPTCRQLVTGWLLASHQPAKRASHPPLPSHPDLTEPSPLSPPLFFFFVCAFSHQSPRLLMGLGLLRISRLTRRRRAPIRLAGILPNLCVCCVAFLCGLGGGWPHPPQSSLSLPEEIPSLRTTEFPWGTRHTWSGGGWGGGEGIDAALCLSVARGRRVQLPARPSWPTWLLQPLEPVGWFLGSSDAQTEHRVLPS